MLDTLDSPPQQNCKYFTKYEKYEMEQEENGRHIKSNLCENPPSTLPHVLDVPVWPSEFLVPCLFSF